MARKAVALTFLIWALSGLNRCFSQTAQGAGFDFAPIQIPTVQKSSDRAITSWDLLALRDVHGLAISPDGMHVAVVIGQAVYETNSYRTSLLAVGTKPGSTPLNLGTAGVPHWDVINQWPAEAPQWSPDSRYITYRARMVPGETMQVWRWTLRNEPPVQLTHAPGDVTKYEWRRDGSGLVLTVQRKRYADEV